MIINKWSSLKNPALRKSVSIDPLKIWLRVETTNCLKKVATFFGIWPVNSSLLLKFLLELQVTVF